MFVMWVLSFLLFIYGLRLKPTMYWMPVLPVICQQVAITQVGYWIYTLNFGGYWFIGTIYLVCISSCFALLRVISLIKKKVVRNLLRVAVVGAVLVFLVPQRAMVIFPGGGIIMFIPFILSALLVAVMCIFAFWVNPSRRWLYSVGAVSIVIFLCYGSMMNYRASYFHNEIRLARAVEFGNLSEASIIAKGGTGKKTRLMRFVGDVVDVLNHSSLDTLRLTLDDGIKPVMVTNAPIHMAQIGGDILYYVAGLPYFSYRWSYENAVKFGFSPRRLRMLLRCALLNGELDVARRYVALLSNTLFYSDFAQEMSRLIENPRLIDSHPQFKPYNNMGIKANILTSDNGFPEKFLIQYLSNTKKVKWQSDSQQYSVTY